MLKVNTCIRISSGYIFLYGRLCSQAVCKTLPSEAVLFFFSFILSSIHRNLAKQDSRANSYVAYGLKCWAVWGFVWAQGGEQRCFCSHTRSPSPPISLGFQEMNIWLWKIQLFVLGCVSCNEERSSTKHRQVTHTYVSSTGRIPPKKAEGVGYFIQEDSTRIWILNTVIIFFEVIAVCFQNVLQRGLY